MSVAPVTLGEFGTFDVKVTLDPAKPSTGGIVVTSHTDGGGTFDSGFGVNVKATFTDIRTAETFTEFVSDTIASSGTPWSHTPPPGYPAEGTEFTLPAGDPRFTSGGFFITTAGIIHQGPHPRNNPATVPEPVTLLLLGAGLAGLGAVARRRQGST